MNDLLKGRVLMAQTETNITVDGDGNVCIHQPSADANFDDSYVTIEPENVPRIIEALLAAQKEALAARADEASQ